MKRGQLNMAQEIDGPSLLNGILFYTSVQYLKKAPTGSGVASFAPRAHKFFAYLIN